MLSVIIPSYKDPLLNKTVDDLLQKAKGDIEIICILDGYWCAPIDDPRVKVIHFGKNRGMREAINAGVRLAKGEYIMRESIKSPLESRYASGCKGQGVATIFIGDRVCMMPT